MISKMLKCYICQELQRREVEFWFPRVASDLGCVPSVNQIYHVCWDGGSCANEYIEVPYDLATVVGIQSGTRVKLEPCYNIPVASRVQLRISRLDDFDILQLEYSVMEHTILNQVRVHSVK